MTFNELRTKLDHYEDSHHCRNHYILQYHKPDYYIQLVKYHDLVTNEFFWNRCMVIVHKNGDMSFRYGALTKIPACCLHWINEFAQTSSISKLSKNHAEELHDLLNIKHSFYLASGLMFKERAIKDTLYIINEDIQKCKEDE